MVGKSHQPLHPLPYMKTVCPWEVKFGEGNCRCCRNKWGCCCQGLSHRWQLRRSIQDWCRHFRRHARFWYHEISGRKIIADRWNMWNSCIYLRNWQWGLGESHSAVWCCDRRHNRKTNEILVYSDLFLTDKGIGAMSSLEEFAANYPDFRIRYMREAGIYVAETQQLKNVAVCDR